MTCNFILCHKIRYDEVKGSALHEWNENLFEKIINYRWLCHITFVETVQSVSPHKNQQLKEN